MANLPVLEQGGTVVYETPEDLEVSVERFLSKGALAVTPRRALAPLEQLEVEVSAAFLVERPRFMVEVVHLDANRAVLRLLAPFDTARLAARTTPPAPAPTPAAAEPDASSVVMKMRAAPGPPAVVEPPAETAILEDGLVRFTTLRAFNEAAPLLAAGQPFAATVGPDARFDVTEALAIVVGAYSHSSQLTATTKRQGDLALVQFTNKTLVASALRAIEAGALAAGEEPASGSLPVAAAPGEGSAPALASAPLQVGQSGLTPAFGIAAPTSGLTPAMGMPAQSTPTFGTPVAAVPPSYGDDKLEFVSRDQYRAQHDHLFTMGAIMAACATPPNPGTEHEVQLVVGGAAARGRARCVIFAASPGMVVVQALDTKSWRPLLEELDAESQAMPRAPLGPKTMNLPRKGSIENPTTPAGVLKLPVQRPPVEDDLRKPTAALLLRWLRGQVGVFRLEVVVEGTPVHTAIFVDGREVRTPVSLQSLAKALAAPRFDYEVHEIARAPLMSTTSRTLHLITELVRAHLARFSSEDIEKAFPEHKEDAPRAVGHVVESVGLPPQHFRFVKSHFNGDERLEEILRAPGGGARVAYDVLFVLELYGALVWGPAEKSTTSARARASAPMEDPLEAMWRSIENKDHFAVMGLHWSSAPAEIPQAYAKLKMEVGPGGIRRGTTPQSKETADKIWRRVERAHQVLNDATERRRYRKTAFNLVWSHQAQLLVAKAKLSLYRKDYVDAKNILHAAQDISPSDEAAAMLAKIAEKAQ